jgi:hypothetical protein
VHVNDKRERELRQQLLGLGGPTVSRYEEREMLQGAVSLKRGLDR